MFFKRLIGIVVVLATIFLMLESYDTIDKKKVSLVSCIDGDTAVFNLKNEEIKVRFIGIDTPELSETKGVEAGQFVCEVLKNGVNISLVGELKSNPKDKYDRYLYWVFVDGRLLQSIILENGYGKISYLDDEYLFYDELFEAENRAKNKNIGIWEK